MKKIMLVAVMVAAVISLLSGTRAMAGEINLLVDKLVQKGILTPAEAQIILDETKAEVAKELAKGEAETAPGWTQKMKIKGDVRFRTQADWGKNDGGTSFANANYRLRERIRVRLGVEGKV
ncbi:MAG: hypothetical protein ABH885_04830, partial [Candidatus Omnitrophota bacterium]